MVKTLRNVLRDFLFQCFFLSLDKLTKPGALNSAMVTQIEKSIEMTRKVLEELGAHNFATEEDLAVVKAVCHFVSRRGAHLVAAGNFLHYGLNSFFILMPVLASASPLFLSSYKL